MTKGFFDDSDPNAKPGEYPTVPQGSYTANKIEMLVGESNFPEFRDSKNGSGRVAFSHLLTEDGKWQIFYSGDKTNYLLLAKAFGVKGKELTKLSGLVESEFLVKVETAINQSGGSVTVNINDKGFVSSIPSAIPPEGIYRWAFVGARSNDGTEPVTFQTHAFAKDDKGNPDPTKNALWLKFAIAGDMAGNKTPYDGYVTWVRFYQPFDGTYNNAPKLRVNANRSKPTAVQRLERFINLYCPAAWDHEWCSSAFDSDYGTDETANPIIVILDYAKKSGRLAVGNFAKKQKGENFGIDLMTMQTIYTEEEEEVDEEEPPADYIFGAERPQLAALCDTIDQQVGGAFIEYPPSSLAALKLNEAGKTWASKSLLDPWIKAGIEGEKRPLNGLSEEEAEKLLVAMGVYRAEEKTPDLPFD